MKTTRTFIAATLFGIVAASTSACGDVSTFTASHSEPPTATRAAALDVERVLSAFAGAPEYDLAVDELNVKAMVQSEWTKAIVKGEVEGFYRGPQIFGEPDGTRSQPTVILALAPSAISAGSEVHDRYYVQLVGQYSLEALKDAVPSGTVVAAYLGYSPQRDGTAMTVTDPDAGRPPGEALWTASPLGLLIATNDDSGVITAELGIFNPRATLDSMLPREMETVQD